MYRVLVDGETYGDGLEVIDYSLDEAKMKVEEIIKEGIHVDTNINIISVNGTNYYVGTNRDGSPRFEDWPINLNV